jgi:CheY-like chemotaxis protein
MNGQQFLTEIKKDAGQKDIPVIIFSTSASARTAPETKDLVA